MNAVGHNLFTGTVSPISSQKGSEDTPEVNSDKPCFVDRNPNSDEFCNSNSTKKMEKDLVNATEVIAAQNHLIKALEDQNSAKDYLIGSLMNFISGNNQGKDKDKKIELVV